MVFIFEFEHMVCPKKRTALCEACLPGCKHLFVLKRDHVDSFTGGWPRGHLFFNFCIFLWVRSTWSVSVVVLSYGLPF